MDFKTLLLHFTHFDVLPSFIASRVRSVSIAALYSQLPRVQVEELDLSHCKLTDTGAHAVGEFLSMHQKLKTLHLANNNIGPTGLAGVINGILKATSMSLKNLDVRLNPLEDEGAHHVCARRYNF